MQYEYQLIILEPDMMRGERVNVGLIVYHENRVDIRMPSSQPKLRGIDPAYTPHVIEKEKARLSEMASVDSVLFRQVSQALGPLHTSEVGWFDAGTGDEYDARVNDLLQRLVLAPKRKVKRAPVSRLANALKNEFRRKGFLGKGPEDIGKHRIIPSYTISEEEGLRADFAYKNGVYHVTTVADLRSKNASMTEKQGRGALKAITMLEGKKRLGGKAYAIYAAQRDQERELMPVITMLGEYSDGNIFNALSGDDMTSYHKIVAGHLGRPGLH